MRQKVLQEEVAYNNAISEGTLEGYNYFLSHYRRTYRKPVETKTVVNLQGKSSSQRFHQRRRRI